MSKAFAKEDDEREEEPAEPQAPAPGRKSYITPEGHKRLLQEMDHLWKVERPKVTSEVAAAAAQGDRSENAEYIYGKKRLREIDRRLRFLARRLDNLIVVAPSQGQADRIFFGAWVTVEDEDGKRSTYRIVGTDEFDVTAGLISAESPLAKALLGKRVGDSVTVSRPKGDCDYEVLEIRYGEPTQL
ncbi:MAG: transcription elongation factor GreB [Deltaproteobacteria bacterium]|nr:transcription elongation factor GreB [Deltaproteobacteria bacterium]